MKEVFLRIKSGFSTFAVYIAAPFLLLYILIRKGKNTPLSDFFGGYDDYWFSIFTYVDKLPLELDDFLIKI